MCVGSQRDTERPCQTEVGKLEVSLRVDQQVLRFEVSVKDTMRMAVVQPLYELIREFLKERKESFSTATIHDGQAHLDDGSAQSSSADAHLGVRIGTRRDDSLHVLFQVHVEKLENEKQLVLGVNDLI